MSTGPVPATTSGATESAETAEQRRDRLRNEQRGRRFGTLIHALARLLYRTVRVQFVNPEGLDTRNKGAIFVTWHGRSLIPANVFRNRGYWALISLSRDGEIQNTVFQRFGFQTIRGSTGRGGVRAALQMARKVKEGGVLAFTPDGPRGPTHKVQHGVILMAEKSGAPIIPLGISATRRWLMRSWDSYMLPKPFSRAYFLVGEPIYVPSDLDEAGREAIAAQVEIAINRLEKEAERLAGHPHYPAEWRTE
jgi:lysophospholipid acyltransferase (LPLAT)-like uncharacterized protein